MEASPLNCFDLRSAVEFASGHVEACVNKFRDHTQETWEHSQGIRCGDEGHTECGGEGEAGFNCEGSLVLVIERHVLEV